MTTTDVRDQIVAIAKEGPSHAATMVYEEVRPMPSINNPLGDWNWRGDCWCWVTWVFKVAGAPDPNKRNYDGSGNTQTGTANGTQISLEQVLPGDVIVYDAFEDLSRQHGVIVVEGGADPLTSSMGKPGDPHLVRVSEDGRTPTFLRFGTTRLVVPPVPGSPASKLPATARPVGEPPELRFGALHPMSWIVYLRELLNVAGIGHFEHPRLGGYGRETADAVIRFKREHPELHLQENSICGAGVWHALGVR